MIAVSPAMLGVACGALGRAAPDLTTPRERVGLLAALVPPLLALDGGDDKLREWAPRVPPDEPPEHLRRRMREALAVYGDSSMADIVIDTLATIAPPPVREYAIAEIAFVLVGWGYAGWTSRLALRGSQLVVLSAARRDADALALLACHELVHCWHRQPRAFADLATLTAPTEQAVLALAHEQAWPALDELPVRERLTDATALSWFCAAEILPDRGDPDGC